MTTEAKQITQSDLDQFHGSEQFYRYGMFHKILMTEGAHFVAEKAGTYWLFDMIISYIPKVDRNDHMFFVELTKNAKGNGAKLVLHDGDKSEDGNGKIIYVEKKIGYTDFPLPSLRLYFCVNGGIQGTKYTAMLPGEY